MKNKKIKMNKGEYVSWTFNDAYMDPYRTKKDAEIARKRQFGKLYSTNKELDKYLPIYQEIFLESFGIEEDVPICTVEERMREQK